MSSLMRMFISSIYSILFNPIHHIFILIGKTQTIALLIRILIAMGQKVLISAYTHSVVDNILIKLHKSGVLSTIAKRICSGGSNIDTNSFIHPNVQSYLLKYDNLDKNQPISLNQFRYDMTHIRLIACTALTAYRNPLVKSIKFDICLVDEAGQILEPNTLGVLMMANRFVLVGYVEYSYLFILIIHN